METIDARFIVRKSKPGTGKGLFADANIAKGDFIAEYTGEKVPTKVADGLNTRYLFELDEEWTIDGESLSNIARYINHSCAPSAEAEIHDDRILICATKGITVGEEITIDYGEEYFDEFIRPVGCRCGAKETSPVRISWRILKFHPMEFWDSGGIFPKDSLKNCP